MTAIKLKNGSAPQVIWPGIEKGVEKPSMRYSPAIKAAGWVFVSGQLATEAKSIWPELENTIIASGCDIHKDVVRIWQWFVARHHSVGDNLLGTGSSKLTSSTYREVRNEYISNYASASSHQIRDLVVSDASLEVEVLCFDDEHESIAFGEPEYEGAHRPALRRGDWVFLASQKAGQTLSGDLLELTVEQQAELVLEKLDNLAKLAGTSLGQAVKAEVCISHPTDFTAMDSVWAKWFPHDPPARVVIPGMSPAYCGDKIQVALTLLADSASISKQTIETSDAPEQPGHEPQAIRVGNLLFFSGQMPFDSSGELALELSSRTSYPRHGSHGRNQMRFMMKNVAAISEAAGTSVDKIVRRVCFHSDMKWFGESSEEWLRYFPDDKPASTVIGLGTPFVTTGATTLLDLIAYVPD